MPAFSGLVLAGRRGQDDPLARAAGARHRALLEVGGVPMLVRAVRALRGSRSVGRIWISIDDPGALDGVPELRALAAEGALAHHASLASPSRSVHDALLRLAPGEKLLVTTADHALLTPQMVDAFADAAEAAAPDVAVAVVAASLLRQHYPESTRTLLRLRGEAFTGANLFAFRTREAARAAEFWVRAERHRKRPWRLVGALGPGTLLLFALRRLDLEAAFERVSRAVGVRIAPVRMPFAEAGIDVDRPSDLVLAERILSQRSRSPSAPNLPVAGS
jgi:GTP:adenosylcobinamide-phosphate guanylyltransferase